MKGLIYLLSLLAFHFTVHLFKYFVMVTQDLCCFFFFFFSLGCYADASHLFPLDLKDYCKRMNNVTMTMKALSFFN